MKIRVDTVFYRIGQWIWIPLLLVGSWFAGYGYGNNYPILECVILRISGFPCPACGGSRAVYYLFTGNIYKSLQNNPIVIYGILAYMHFMGSYFFRHHFKEKESAGAKEIQISIYIYGAIAVLLIQWFVKILRILI